MENTYHLYPFRKTAMRRPLRERIWSGAIEDEHGCWVWQRAVSRTGYGVTGMGSEKTALAHRISYELAYGEIPEGADIDHLCGNRACIRPEHLKAVTKSENLAVREASRFLSDVELDPAILSPDDWILLKSAHADFKSRVLEIAERAKDRHRWNEVFRKG